MGEYREVVQERPDLREAQRRVAQEVTRLVHGESGLAKAEQASKVLFGGELAGLSALEIQEIFAAAPSVTLPANDFAGDGMPLANLLEAAGIAKSRGEARRLIESGGVYVNNMRINEAGHTVGLSDSIEGKFLVLRKGKKDYALVRIE